MINKDGAPSLTKGDKQRYSHHHVLGVDCDRNADTALNFYWWAHGRCHWSNSPVPLNERTPPQGLHRAPTSNDICAAI
jgi:hypothetical protein